MGKKEKIVASIIIFFLFLSFVLLGWLTKTGGFKILADVIQNPQLLTK